MYLPCRQINISLLDKPNQPFVSLNLQPIPLISRPTLPICMAYIPLDLNIVMASMSQSDDWKESGSGDLAGSLLPEMQMRATGKVEDGEAYPELKMDGLWSCVNAKISCSMVGIDMLASPTF
jgi:hypothetical protein